MEYAILHSGSNAVVHVSLQRGEKIRAEAGSMVARSTALSIKGKMWGGVFGAMKRSFLGGETFFFQEISALDRSGEVVLAPRVLGDIKVIAVEHGQDFFVQSGCLLAAFENVEMDTRAQRLAAGLFSGAGIFVLHLKGEGHIAVSSFGAIMEVPIPSGEQYVIDNGHVVAWSGDTEYKIVKAASTWVSSFTTGGMLACQFTGPGKVWLQTRNPSQFGNWVRRFVPRGISLIG